VDYQLTELIGKPLFMAADQALDMRMDQSSRYLVKAAGIRYQPGSFSLAKKGGR
jgi:hypothetical protein